MTFQTIDNIFMFIVDLPEPPKTLLPIINDEGPFMQPYVEALDTAIRRGIITEPGKYGIHVKHSVKTWTIHKINE